MRVKRFKTLEDYIEAAVGSARFERIEGGSKVYAEIPGFRGVWAEGHSRQEARQELREVLKGWIELQAERGHSLPLVKGIRPAEVALA